MKIKNIKLTDYHKYCSRGNGMWIEGVELIGYSKEGDSFLLSYRPPDGARIFICVSKSFLRELLHEEGNN